MNLVLLSARDGFEWPKTAPQRLPPANGEPLATETATIFTSQKSTQWLLRYASQADKPVAVRLRHGDAVENYRRQAPLHSQSPI